MLNDRELLKKAKGGCKESMRMIYVRYKDPLLTLACSLLNNRDLAEDVVQDVFVAFG